MNLLRMVGSSIYQIVALIFFVAFLLGILNIHFSDRSNYCEMTYMYEYPQFVKISLPENKNHPQYALYAYSEGRFTERARKMWFDGVPVLFLPGNSGSHMQARSLASVALRKAIPRDFHFDYFTISFNEELSGLYGGVLHEQTKFAAMCVTKILNLYKSNKYTKSVPTSVILIGHSMGGLIAKRLMAYPSTINATNITIALAAPIAAPVINFDSAVDDYYTLMEMEWAKLNANLDMKEKKMLITFGSGPRDILMPAGLTASNDSDLSALTTAVPGVWTSTDHVSIVWCKQLVLAINRYLFSIVDPVSKQIVQHKTRWMAAAKTYFQANRSMTLNPKINQPLVGMQADAFWYEDNRRIYQISRPEIDKMTYLMIRLVSFPQNRFVAVESVNLDDKDWLFGCNAQYTYNTYRYCKQGTSLAELSRWSGAATDFGRRKLATINLHSLVERHPDWTHVVVKVSPTRKPVTLNIDINDHASRQIVVDLPSDYSIGRAIIKQETEANALYYELLLPGFNAVFQAYLLYVEPTAGCKAQYHVSAEVNIPWADNHEYYHYFTPNKRSPMKLRLYKTSPNVTRGHDPLEPVKVILLLDPQCKYTISISSSWYHLLAQSVRTFAPVLIPYIAATVLLVARSIILHLNTEGSCLSIHGALLSDALKPYSPLLFVRMTITLLMAIPILSFVVENASWNNDEIQYFIRSIMVLPAYMTALGSVAVFAAGVLAVMVFSSQLAHRMLFRILWRGGHGLAERVALGLQKVPMIVSATLICAAPLSCGAASLAAGAAFYAFMISKMYEEYLEDYFYRLLAKFGSKICRAFKKEKPKSDSETSLIPEPTPSTSETDPVIKAIEDKDTETDSKNLIPVDDKKPINEKATEDPNKTPKGENPDDKEANVKEANDKEANDQEANDLIPNENVDDVATAESKATECDSKFDNEVNNDIYEDGLDSINFHMMMFFLWIVVTAVNVPALLTWARNFKYSMVLKPDTSYIPGLVLSVCSTSIWQMNGARKNLRYYDVVAAMIFIVAVIIFTLGPLSLTFVNYGVTFVFGLITLQQICDYEEIPEMDDQPPDYDEPSQEVSDDNSDHSHEDDSYNKSDSNQDSRENSASESERPNEECDPCNEGTIYNVFKNLREKFSFNDD